MLVCNCKIVNDKEIEKFVKKYPLSTFSDFVLATGASSGCGRCKNVAEEQFTSFMKKQGQGKQLSIDFER